MNMHLQIPIQYCNHYKSMCAKMSVNKYYYFYYNYFLDCLGSQICAGLIALEIFYEIDLITLGSIS